MIDTFIGGLAISTIVLGVAGAYNTFLADGLFSVLVPVLAVIPVVLFGPSLRSIRNPLVRYGLAGIIWASATVGIGSLTFFGGAGDIVGSVTDMSRLGYYAFSGVFFIIAVVFTDIAQGKFRQLG